MERLRKLAWPIALTLSAVFLFTALGCKTTRAEKEYEEQRYDPEPEPDEGPPGPPPPTIE